jgi:DNA polymerase-1
MLPMERTFKVPNVDNFIEEGKKVPLKFRKIVLSGLVMHMEVEATTASGWPSVSGAALRTLAGNVSVDYASLQDDNENELPADLNEGSADWTTSVVNVGEKRLGSEEEVDSSIYGTAYNAFGGGKSGREACHAIAALCEVSSINTLISNFLQPLQGKQISGPKGRVHCSLNINTETGRLSSRKPNLQNQPALEKDRYKIRQAFIAEPGNCLIVADYGQLELRILAHLSNCKSMRDAFKAGGDFHSRTAMNMYSHVRKAVEEGKVLLEWDRQPGEEKPPIPLLKDVFATERRQAKMLNFSIAYGKTPIGLSKDWKVTQNDAQTTVDLWYKERQEVRQWQEERKKEAHTKQCVYTLLGRARHFPNMDSTNWYLQGHIERAAINTPVQGSAADVAMCAMLEISRNSQLEKLGWKLLLQVHDEVILEGPTETAEEAKSLVIQCMSYPFNGKNILSVDLAVDAKCAPNWYDGK